MKKHLLKCFLLVVVLLISVRSFAQAINIGYNRNYTGKGTGSSSCPAGRSCYYVDQVNGNDNNDGLAETVGGGHGPWKNAPGMDIATPSSVAATHTFTQTDML